MKAWLALVSLAVPLSAPAVVVGERVVEGTVEAFDQSKVSIRAGNKVYWVPRESIDQRTKLEEGRRVRAHLTLEQYRALGARKVPSSQGAQSKN